MPVHNNSFACSPIPILLPTQTLPRLPPKVLKDCLLVALVVHLVPRESIIILSSILSASVKLDFVNLLHTHTPTSLNTHLSLHNRKEGNKKAIHAYIQVITIDTLFHSQPSHQYSTWPSRSISLLSTTAALSAARQLTLVHTTTALWAPSVLAAHTETGISSRSLEVPRVSHRIGLAASCRPFYACRLSLHTIPHRSYVSTSNERSPWSIHGVVASLISLPSRQF